MKKNIFIESLSTKTRLNDVSTLNDMTISLLDQLRKIFFKDFRFFNRSRSLNQCQHQHNRSFQSIKSINFSTICQFYWTTKNLNAFQSSDNKRHKRRVIVEILLCQIKYRTIKMLNNSLRYSTLMRNRHYSTLIAWQCFLVYIIKLQFIFIAI